jgi:nucleotide-binding universal stress UspA family protein
MAEISEDSMVGARNCPHPQRNYSMMPPNLIMVPLDFSAASQNALDVATRMASHVGATLLLVHIAPVIADLPANVSIFKEGEYNKELHEEAGKRLSKIAAGLEAKKLNVRTQVGTANDVGMELVRLSERDSVDMIIIATHGMTGWREVAFGSVAKIVVERAACPVLVLRAKAENRGTEPDSRAGTAAQH